MLMTLLAESEEVINLTPKDKWADLGSLSIGGIISGAIQFVLVVAAVVFFFILVVGGIKWIVSGGDKTKTEGARNQITAALVGLVIVFAAWAIIKLIQTFFGINIMELDIPTA